MLSTYIDRFKKLNTNRNRKHWLPSTHYCAPHKPLLLLTVIDLFAQGEIKTNLVEITFDLSELFTIYWSRVMPHDYRGKLHMPFFHLQGDGFWRLIPRPGKEAALEATRRVTSIAELQDAALGARLDDELYDLLCAQKSRDLLRNTLIETYFAPELWPALVEQGAINAEAFQYSQMLLDDVLAQREKEKPVAVERYKPAARDQGFRRAVVTAYDHRCALCGIRILTPERHTAVVGAHIIPWSVSQNDDPRNGMALCSLCHWVFDEGLVGVSSEYAMMISQLLTANDNIPAHLQTLDRRLIIVPAEQLLWPSKESLRWHRRHVFRRR
jgi:putative restriction endonuclease